MKYPRKSLWRNWRYLLLLVGSMAWFGLLAGAAYPAWRAALKRAAEVDEVESRIDHLNRWTVAGVWIEKDVRERATMVETEFARLFPPAPDRPSLFLRLAQIADENGVEGLDLATVEYREEAYVGATERMPATDAEMRAPAAAAGALASTDLDLRPYRLRARFAADLRRTAGFLRAVVAIDRAITVHSIVAHPASEGVEVELELDVYVHENI